MSSDQGLVAVRNLVPYVASKHGILGLTKVAALEYATDNIRVNAICPGIIHTEKFEKQMKVASADTVGPAAIIPMKRIGRSEEVAEAVLWLCSIASSYITGLSLVIDGGYLAQ